MAGPAALPFTEDDAANRLLASNPLALMIGMLLDQQIPMERAFFSPYLLQERLGGSLDAEAIAMLDEDEFIEVADGKDLLKQLEALPGFGKAKARIFVGVVGKRLGAGPPGWEETAADWPSIADVDSFEKVLELREHKRAMKAAKEASS